MSTHSTFRQSASWDPLLILGQIALVQCTAYTTFSVLAVAASHLSPLALSPELLFSSTPMRGDTVTGYLTSLLFLTASLANILPLVYLVERSRLCVDFAVTFAAVHVILVLWLDGLPTSLLWWLTVAAGATAMALGGRAACARREMLPIAIRRYLPERRENEVQEQEEEMELQDRTLPQVVFEAPPDIAIDIGPEDSRSASVRHEPSAPPVHATRAAASKPNGQDNDDDDDDDWNDNWGEEEEELGDNQLKPQKTSRPPPATKGAKHD